MKLFMRTQGSKAVVCLMLGGVPLAGLPLAAQALGLSKAAQTHLQWVREAGDNGTAPFVIIDKKTAHLWLFNARGQGVGDTPVLLGLAHGDLSVPGIGERPMGAIRPEERTTPAGRFLAEAGHNAKGEDIFWVDYNAALSLHRVRTGNVADQRLARLATPTPDDNRISYGCINVPAAFYDSKIRPMFTQWRGLVYILPESLAPEAVFKTR
jgi:hypothetical protein